MILRKWLIHNELRNMSSLPADNGADARRWEKGILRFLFMFMAVGRDSVETSAISVESPKLGFWEKVTARRSLALPVMNCTYIIL